MDYSELTDYKPLMNVKETATFLRVGTNAIYTLVKKNEIPHITVGGKIRIIRDKLMVWMTSGQQV